MLQLNGLKTILVVPPLRDDKAHLELFSSKHFEALYPLISAFSLVTYDFSNLERPGANSPLHWIKHAVEHVCPETLTNFKTKRQKILIGMNLYGFDYTTMGGGPIVGHQFLDLLKNLKGRLVHDEHDEENFFEIKLVIILKKDWLRQVHRLMFFVSLLENPHDILSSIQHYIQSINGSN